MSVYSRHNCISYCFIDENERLKEELNKMKTDFERMRKEAQAAREHYEKYGTELNQNVLQLSTKVSDVSVNQYYLRKFAAGIFSLLIFYKNFFA